MAKIKKDKSIINDAIIKDIADVVSNLAYGEIAIKVHDYKIAQIEVTERKRFNDVWLIGEGGGI